MKKLLAGLGMMAATTVMAAETGYHDIAFSAGLGAVIHRSIYKTKDTHEVMPLIPIDFRYNDFYIKTLEREMGYHLFSEDGMTLSLIGRFNMGYDSDDLERKYRSMDDRDFDFHAGLKSTYEYENMEFTSFITRDVSGETDGMTVGMDGRIHLQVVPGRVVFTPVAGMTYADRHYVDYFYGVKGSEADKISGVDGEYRGAGSMIYHLRGNLSFIYDEDLTFIWLNGVDIYDSKIKNSPIVDKRYGYYTGGGFIYKFK